VIPDSSGSVVPEDLVTGIPEEEEPGGQEDQCPGHQDSFFKRVFWCCFPKWKKKVKEVKEKVNGEKKSERKVSEGKKKVKEVKEKVFQLLRVTVGYPH